MAKKRDSWVCFKCQTPNHTANKFCSYCQAQRPLTVGLFNGEADIENLVPEEENEDQHIPGTPYENGHYLDFAREQSKSRTRFADFTKAVEMAKSRELSPKNFAKITKQYFCNVEDAFLGINAETATHFEEGSRLKAAINMAIEDTYYLFGMVSEELSLFKRPKDVQYLRTAWTLMMKSENYLQGVIGLLASEANNDIIKTADLVCRPALQYVLHGIGKEAYCQHIKEAEIFVNTQLEEADKKLATAFEMAKAFDTGKNLQMQRVTELVQDSVESLGKTIAAVHILDENTEVLNTLVSIEK